MKSVNDSLEKVRKPRVHIKYEVEENGATLTKDIPFVVGVMGDYSGSNKDKLEPFKDRKFIQIDGDNFNQVMENIQPSVSIKVQNKLTDDDSQLGVDLTFKSIDDFNPDNIVNQIEPLKKLMETRTKLRELQAKADRSDKLEQLLEQILQDDDSLKLIREQIGSVTTDKKE